MTAKERKEKLTKLAENYIRYHCYSRDEKYFCEDYFYWKAYLYGFCDALEYDVYYDGEAVVIRDPNKTKSIVIVWKCLVDCET